MKRLIWIVLVLLLLSGCGEQRVETLPALTTIPPVEKLRPYATITPGETITPDILITETPFPLPTPTPRTHAVKQGEDLGGIAYLYKVSLDALLSANPEISPRLLSVGTILVIPPSEVTDSEVSPIPTPMDVFLDDVHCAQTKEGGAYCFVTAFTNELSVENVSAEFRVFSQTEDQWNSKLAVSPLNLLRANKKVPLVVYFPPPLEDISQSSVELRTALPVLDEESRYPSVEIAEPEVKISEDGQSAESFGNVLLSGEKEAKEVWVVMVAYDQENRVVGLRRWESGKSIAPGESVEFRVEVYSISGKIDRVELLAEAHS